MAKFIYILLITTLTLFATTAIADQSPAISIIKELKTKRDGQGGVVIYGKINLPPQTKLMIDFGPAKQKRIFGQSTSVVSDDGQFQTEGFTNKEEIYKAGLYKVIVISYFNSNWQSPDILAQTGENGTKLPASALIPDDSEFPNEGRHLEEMRIVKLTKPNDEMIAIDTVKNSRLVVKGSGKSVESVKNIVAWHENVYATSNPTAVKAIGWSATQSSPNLWIVTLEFYNEGNKDKAQWEYNSKTKAVRYLNKSAKIFSWMPAN